jgi:nucleotide-binding universal stress UspA family protein
MFETVVIATDGSESAQRAVRMALDFATRFDADVHALYVVDETEIQASPDEIRADLEQALEEAGGEALSFVCEQSSTADVDAGIVTAVREGEPAGEIIGYAKEHEADVIATGTRGRHGDHAFLLGSVAEAIVRRSPTPVLTVRQLSEDERAT